MQHSGCWLSLGIICLHFLLSFLLLFKPGNQGHLACLKHVLTAHSIRIVSFLHYAKPCLCRSTRVSIALSPVCVHSLSPHTPSQRISPLTACIPCSIICMEFPFQFSAQLQSHTSPVSSPLLPPFRLLPFFFHFCPTSLSFSLPSLPLSLPLSQLVFHASPSAWNAPLFVCSSTSKPKNWSRVSPVSRAPAQSSNKAKDSHAHCSSHFLSAII